MNIQIILFDILLVLSAIIAGVALVSYLIKDKYNRGNKS